MLLSLQGKDYFTQCRVHSSPLKNQSGKWVKVLQLLQHVLVGTKVLELPVPPTSSHTSTGYPQGASLGLGGRVLWIAVRGELQLDKKHLSNILGAKQGERTKLWSEVLN